MAKELQMVLVLVGQLHEQADGEIDEAVNLMYSNPLHDEWWARRIAADLESTEGPASFKDLEGNTPAVIVEMAFWAGWLKGEFDTLGMLNETLRVLNKQTPSKGE